MLIKTKAIVISSLRYQDKSLIVKCFTKSDGLKSYFVRDVFSGKKNNKKASYFQPLTLLEIEANHKNKNTLEYFNNIKPIVYQSIYSDFLKSSLVLFISEILNSSIKDEGKNEDLFLFLEAALLWFDQNPININFHLSFLIELTKFLGFYPSFSDDTFFDLHEGIFVSVETESCLSDNESNLLKIIMNQKINSIDKIFTNSQRKHLLEILMNYYTIHIENFKKPNSIEVFKEVFS